MVYVKDTSDRIINLNATIDQHVICNVELRGAI